MNRMILRAYLQLIFIGFLSFSVHAQEVYPTPEADNNRLFYVQRSGNTNTIMYDAKYTDGNKLDSDCPIHVYWVIYNENGKKKELSFIQRKLAYGVDITPLPNKNEYEFTIVSYPKKKLYLYTDQRGVPYAAIDINGKRANLHKVFVKIDPRGVFSLTPKVKYVELFGFDPVTGESVYEKIIISV